MKISRDQFDGIYFKVPIGSIGDDEYNASICVPPYAADAAEIVLFKNDEEYYCEKWGYQESCRFYGETGASDDKNIDALNNELERLRNCIKKYNDSVILIQRRWRERI